MQNLIGEYAHKMDAKGRVAFPANFRKTISEGANLVIAPSPSSNCLYVYLKDDYIAWVDEMFEGIGGYDVNNEDHVEMKSFLMGAARDAELDGAGRIAVTPRYREEFGLSSEVILVGNGNRVEIWDPHRRAEQNERARALRAKLLFRSPSTKE